MNTQLSTELVRRVTPNTFTAPLFTVPLSLPLWYVSQGTKIFPQACHAWYPYIVEWQVVDIREHPVDCSPCTHGENFAVFND